MLARSLSKPASGCFSCPCNKALRIIVFFPISTRPFLGVPCECLASALKPHGQCQRGGHLDYPRKDSPTSKYAFFLASFS